jgi:TonB-dependent starch-binding outer membrane protein SusC
LFFQGSAGRKEAWLPIYNNTNFAAQRYASSWMHWTEPWSHENRNGSWPRLYGSSNRNTQTFWVDDLSFIRLKNVQLGYKVPQALLDRVNISSLRLYTTAENLLTFTQFRGLDPEKQGHVSDAYPLIKSFSFGINLGI